MSPTRHLFYFCSHQCLPFTIISSLLLKFGIICFLKEFVKTVHNRFGAQDTFSSTFPGYDIFQVSNCSSLYTLDGQGVCKQGQQDDLSSLSTSTLKKSTNDLLPLLPAKMSNMSPNSFINSKTTQKNSKNECMAESYRYLPLSCFHGNQEVPH